MQIHALRLNFYVVTTADMLLVRQDQYISKLHTCSISIRINVISLKARQSGGTVKPTFILPHI